MTPVVRNPRIRLRHARRRGNTLVLVTAILVLLVIIATAFVTRTQSGRQVASAQQAASQREDRVASIANDLAMMIGDSLFPQPIDPTAVSAGPGIGYRADPNDPTIQTVVSSWPRLQTPSNSTRFSIDRDSNGDLIPDFLYNAPAYDVKPWTNWPDFLTPAFPYGPGQPNGAVTTPTGTAIGDANPYGNPGTNDTRWLRSTEPVRADTNGDGVPDAFSHWPHLSWIATANNGYRVVTDISDIVPNTLWSLGEGDFTTPWAVGLPYEQWLNNVAPAPVPDAPSFRSRVNQWFAAPSQPANYATNYVTSSALPNLFRLADLKANVNDPPNPSDAFKPGTIRNAVERTFADTDGDGITDAFWFLYPSSIDRGVRTLVAVSIVDNSALLDANVATRFSRFNTTGATPSDVALVDELDAGSTSVGFLDTPANSYPVGAPNYPTLYNVADVGNLYKPVGIAWSRDRLGDLSTLDGLTFLQAIGMKNGSGAFNLAVSDMNQPYSSNNQSGEFYSPLERLLYFKSAGLFPEEPRYALTPFGAAEEFELRAYHGQNLPYVLSRFERAMNTEDNVFSFLRSSPNREETSEYLDQLSIRQLLLDNRRKLTMFAGARNDVLPPWLWPSPYANPSIDYNRDGQVGDTDGNYSTIENPAAASLDYDAYQRQTRKFDLRRAVDDPINGSVALSANDITINRRNWRVDLQQVLERSLTRSWPAGGGTRYQSYLGRADDQSASYQREQYDKTRELAASMAANAECYRDGPTVLGTPPNVIVTDPPLHPALAVQDPVHADLRFIGQEKQPYIAEVFTAIVYPKSKLNLPPTVPGQVDPYQIPLVFQGGGEHFVDSSSKPSVVIAVQIANPHDTPISLADFRLRLFGNSFNFATSSYGPMVTLGPATARGPTTAIVYAIKDAPGSDPPPATFEFTPTWLDFLDIEPAELYTDPNNPANQTLILDASGAWLGSVTVNSPAVDPNNPLNDPNGETVELVRFIGPQAGPGASQPAAVVVDRFDNRVSGPQLDFATSFSRLFTDDRYYPPLQAFDYNPANPPNRNWMNGIRIGSNDYFVAWCRASRAWTWDVNTDGFLAPNEENPRYVFSIGGDPVLPTETQDGSVGGASRTYRGDTYSFGQDPDGTDLWISYSYVSAMDKARRGKPTFFPCVVRETGGPDNQYGLGFPYPDPISGIYPNGVTVGDKGLQKPDWTALAGRSALKAPFQMLIKDDDFVQIGEFLNVFCWGPVIDVGSGVTNPTTERTFSEILVQEADSEDQPAGRGVFVNRLHVAPFRETGTDGSSPSDGPTPVLGTPPSAPYVPALPAGTGIFDALVCDDRGARVLDDDGNGLISTSEYDAAEGRRLRNAAAYSGRTTYGQININTALPEVMRALPFMTRLVNNDADFGVAPYPVDQVSIPPGENPFTRVVDSIQRYRDRSINGASGTIIPAVPATAVVPNYVDRGLGVNAVPNTPGFLGPAVSGGLDVPAIRGDRGFGSLGELLLLQRIIEDTGGTFDDWRLSRSYNVQFAGLDPYRWSIALLGMSGMEYINGWTPRFSTDVNIGRNYADPDAVQQTLLPPAKYVPDRVAGDAEEQNLLFSGISNLVSTRSDVFTVYFRVRSVRQDPVSLAWDGTKPELIVDDSRYVMLVDRSNVNKPGDRPKIIYFQKVSG